MLEPCGARKENEWALGINVIFNGRPGGPSNGRRGDEPKYKLLMAVKVGSSLKYLRS